MIESGDWGRYLGPYAPELCRKLAEFHAVEHVQLSSSGTSAVELALRGVGVQDGDEVIMAAYDFKSNFQNILHLKAMPVLVDLDPLTFQLDPNQLSAAITPKTRAILVSHLHGAFVPIQPVREIAAAHGIAIVEDACQSTGAIVDNQRVGARGDVGVISFGGSKLLTAGRGGAILTSQSLIFERIKRHVLRGNDAYPLSEIQAALVIPQLEQLDDLNERRRRAAARICDALQDIEGLLPLQWMTNEIRPAYYRLGFCYHAEKFGLSRDHFIAAARAEGIAIDPGFRSNHLIHGSRRFRAVGELSEATRADQEIVSVYHPVLIEDDAAIDQVAAAISKIHAQASQIAEAVETNQQS